MLKTACSSAGRGDGPVVEFLFGMIPHLPIRVQRG